MFKNSVFVADKELGREIKNIKKIILHCSDSDNPAHNDISVIRQWHLKRGFLDCGYHYFIKADGTLQVGRALYIIGAHCIGHNFDSIGICLSGKNSFSHNQLYATWILCRDLMERFEIKRKDIYPHNYFSKNKTCPNFKLTKLWSFDNDGVA